MTSILPGFLAISYMHPGAQHLDALSPKIMQWSNNLWLIDLRPVHTYWSRKLHMSSYEEHHIGFIDYLKRQNILEGGSITCTAEHPWIALIMLMHMKARQLDGTMHYSSLLGKKLFDETPWEIWGHALEDLSSKLRQTKHKTFREGTFKKQRQLLIKYAPRLGLTHPNKFLRLNPSSVRKRFGTILEAVWCWAQSDNDFAIPDTTHGMPFPWIDWTPSNPITIYRHLDFPLRKWEHIEPFLRSDIDTLCQHSEFDRNDLVFCLEWSLLLSSKTSLMVPIKFRHPHPLFHEIGTQKTALLQASYSLEHCHKQMEYEDGYAHEVIGWELTLKERLRTPPKVVDLFDNSLSSLQSLQEIENMLAIPLRSFRYSNHWIPEYAHTDVNKQHTDSIINKQQADLAACRPLLMYRDPFYYTAPESTNWTLLERTMDSWWLNFHGSYRNYYLVSHQNGDVLWVFRKDKGDIFIHGIFA